MTKKATATKTTKKAPAKTTKAATTAKATTKAAKTATETKAPAKSATTTNKIAKTQLVELVADRTGLTKKQSEEAVSVMLEIIIEAIKEGKSVGLPGLGTLSIKDTAPRIGVRPGTNERIEIPAGKKVAFKLASTLKGKL